MTEKGSAASLNEIYAERNQLVACFARACHLLGMRAWLGTDPIAAEDPEWGPVVFVELPTGQVSWHIRSDERPMFSFLMEPPPDAAGVPAWDGHSNGEKFLRLMEWKDEALRFHSVPKGTE